MAQSTNFNPDFDIKQWIFQNYNSTDVCLISMPVAASERPSLGLGLLNAILKKNQVLSSVIYANMLFAESIGNRDSLFIESNQRVLYLCDGIFSQSAFETEETAPDIFINRYINAYLYTSYSRLPENQATRHCKAIYDLAVFAKQFINNLADAIIALNPKIVGCSTMFQQTVASIALLRRIKLINPEIVTIIGGSNCEGIFGKTIIQQYPFVDYVVSGEADEIIFPLVKKIFDNKNSILQNDLPYGVLGKEYRNKNSIYFSQPEKEIPRAFAKKIDEIPIPDYDDFFKTVNQLKINKYLLPGILYETSRGCWWARKHRCSFCGLNGTDMQFRTKSSNIVLEQLKQIVEKYQLNSIEITDNILDINYFKTLIPELIEKKLNYNLFFETKANLKPNQLKMLMQAGIRVVQPGLESLSNEVLKLIHKGTTTLQNIQFLKYSKKYGIRASWNFLYGIPCEKHEWYDNVIQIIPKIVHLQPPSKLISINFNRTSEYFENQKKYNLNLKPNSILNFFMPFSEDILQNMFIFMEDKDYNTKLQHSVYKKLDKYILDWKKLYYSVLPPVLNYQLHSDKVEIIDLRPYASKKIIELDEIESAVFLLTDAMVLKKNILKLLKEKYSIQTDDMTVNNVINKLLKLNLLYEDEHYYLNLAIEGTANAIIDKKDFPGGLNSGFPETYDYYYTAIDESNNT